MGNQGFIAHVRFDEQGEPVEHWLEDHLLKVSKRAAGYAESFSGKDWAALADLWHDLGKYNPEFQNYIRDQTGYERSNAHVEHEQSGRVDHSTAGAIQAVEQLGIAGHILAYRVLPAFLVGSGLKFIDQLINIQQQPRNYSPTLY